MLMFLLKIGGGELLTFSICPECYSDFFEKYTNKFGELKIDEYRRLLSENIKIIEAKIFEENGKMYMFKECEEHGEFKDYLGLSELYYRAKKYDLLGKGAITPKNKEKYKCPFDCGPCVNHKSHTVLAIIDVTNRCNMACPICFASSGKPEYIYEPSYSDIKRMVTEAIRNGAVALQNSGGEPTVRDDLDKIIRIEKSTGIHHIEVNTNGLRIAMEGPRYARKLVESGVNNFYLQFDAVGEDGDEVYQKLRGRKLWKVKEECIENLREGGCRSVTLVVTFSKEINGKELGKVIKFAEENPDIVRCVNVQPFSHTGRGFDFEQKRTTNHDFILEVERGTNGKLRRDHFFPVPSTLTVSHFIEAIVKRRVVEMSPHFYCGTATFEVMVNGEYVPISEFIDVERFFDDLEEKSKSFFYNALPQTVVRAMRFFSPIGNLYLEKLLSSYFKPSAPRELKEAILGIFTNVRYDSLKNFTHRSLMIGSMHFMDPYSWDRGRVERCVIHYPQVDGMIIPFCTYNLFYRPYYERRYSRPRT